MSSRTAWSTERVLRQLELHRETLTQKEGKVCSGSQCEAAVHPEGREDIRSGDAWSLRIHRQEAERDGCWRSAHFLRI